MFALGKGVRLYDLLAELKNPKYGTGDTASSSRPYSFAEARQNVRKRFREWTPEEKSLFPRIAISKQSEPVIDSYQTALTVLERPRDHRKQHKPSY